jgi:outer membrane protein OmpA-like peptidoglycan-associated protein
MVFGFKTRFSALLVTTLLCSGAAHSAMRSYGASLEKSTWQVDKTTKISCRLSHEIPRFGTAVFATSASKSKPVNFVLDALVQPENYAMASVTSVPPSWRGGEAATPLINMKLLKQFDSELTNQNAWLLLAELEKGNRPTFHYQDWQNTQDTLNIALNSVNFKNAYDSFLACRDAMLPFAFEDIAYTVMRYESNSSELTKESKKRLEKIGQYIQADPNIESVVINAYTDSYGGRYNNQVLSQKRAEAISNFMKEKGLADARIITEGFGEKRHVATNNTVIGRSKNRRVVIQIEKP